MIDELGEGIFGRIIAGIIYLLRLLFEFIYHGLFETVFWWIGWVFLRIVTFGKYPCERISEAEKSSPFTYIFVRFFGFVMLVGFCTIFLKDWV
jgi:hypothetical protein